MPTTPKKSEDVLVWNRGRVDGNGHYRAGNWILNYQVKMSDGKASPVIHPITTGLALVPRVHWERALEDAGRVGSGHPLTIAIESGRLVPDVNLAKLAAAREAIDQTASKTVIDKVASGQLGATPELAEYAADVKAKWHTRDISFVRQVTRHFASFDRAV